MKADIDGYRGDESVFGIERNLETRTRKENHLSNNIFFTISNSLCPWKHQKKFSPPDDDRKSMKHTWMHCPQRLPSTKPEM